MALTPADNWPSTTNGALKTFAVLWNSRSWPSASSGGNAVSWNQCCAIHMRRPETLDWSRDSVIGLHGWRKKVRGLLRLRAGVPRRLRRQRPVERFGKGIEHVARGAFHRHALAAETMQENGAIRSFKAKKVCPAQRI